MYVTLMSCLRLAVAEKSIYVEFRRSPQTGRLYTALFSIAFFLCLPVFAHTVRSMSDARLWETVEDRDTPLSWPWEDAADSATLVFSNRLDGAVSSVVISRDGDETRGICPQPSPLDGESIVDVELVQASGGSEVARETATLAYVDGAGGGPITVGVKGTAAWRRVRSPRVFAFDQTWCPLYFGSGYDVAPPYDPGTSIRIR